MNQKFRTALSGALLGLALTSANATLILRWERLPLTVPLVVGEERPIFIDRKVRVGVPPQLASQLRVQSAGGVVYLRPSVPIPAARIELQDVETSALILLDISAEAAKAGQPTLEPVRIVEAGKPTSSAAESPSDSADSSQERSSVGSAGQQRRHTPPAVTLTRYAAQSLYAPLRTVEPVSGISRGKLRTDLPLDTLMPTLPVKARALATWRLDDLWVTAVRLTNTRPGWVELDPRALQGDFAAATFQHQALGPAGRSTDTTVVYLVTRGSGLAESLLPRISPIDATVNLPPASAAGDAVGANDAK